LVERQTEANAVLGNAIRDMEELERREIWLTADTALEMTERALELSRLLEETRFALQRETAERERLDDKERQILKLGASLEGSQSSNLAHLEERIDRQRRQLRLLRRDRDALVHAFRWVEEAAELYSRTYRDDLEARISERFGTLTGVPGRKIRLDEGFSLTLVEPRGDALTLVQLSQGARDQLSLAVRLAVADLLTEAVPLPLFFDDPFVHYDAERLQNLRRTLDALGRERQWILLTHREDLGSWAEPVRREEAEGAR
jgi:chromosome segregation protein